MTDGLMNPTTPTLANPGELGPSAAPAPAPKPAAAPENPRATFEQRRHAQDQAIAGDAPPPSADQQQPPPPAASTEKHKIGAYEVSEIELAEMMTRQAADDLRKATVPPTPDAYKLEISPDAKLPGDKTFQFDGNDPGLIAAKAWAHSKGLDQSSFSEMLTLYASHVVAQETALATRARAEIEKAGVNAGMRVDAISKWIRGEVGDADAKPILATIVTDAHLRFYEKLHHKITSQGVAGFSSAHRVPPDTAGIPGFDKMSFEQKRQAQDTLAARRNGR